MASLMTWTSSVWSSFMGTPGAVTAGYSTSLTGWGTTKEKWRIWPEFTVKLLRLFEDTAWCLWTRSSSVCGKNSSSEFQGSSVPNVTEIPVDDDDDDDGGAIRCSLREVKGTASVQCKVTKCTSVTFEALFEFGDVNKQESFISKWSPAGCSNRTV